MEKVDDCYKLLKKAFGNEKLTFNDIVYARFIQYKELIKEWNEKINLTAITDDKEIIQKHFIDSIKSFQFSKLNNCKNIIDVGTGAGFPGIPIKIVNENINVTLLDSLNKRIKFLDCVIESLELKGIETFHGRAEEMSIKNEFRERYDCAISRAVANLSSLSEYCLPFVRINGYFVAMKGPAVEKEILDAKNAIKVLGGKLEEVIPVTIEDTEFMHNLVIIKKIQSTPDRFPRKSANISKKPII
ncbi:16S rRNA (guanine(527)-N(7))-methyltransferase RsmG [Clostridium oryzae]|uniref:Ribosomal RNA small subunit methyltransferase G n=1 Tax=Clostridium oryzae TaxID=1450648 RepID=A0A1V4IFQ8_9CLOT|nr:16S rRNA (guanine(527)-N(7))-methyltransferase RsmG [Clostridium oryzae]OPJ58674.1 ribosomal RNA small subunit methyltransferase G [Clostridium oryzae]